MVKKSVQRSQWKLTDQEKARMRRVREQVEAEKDDLLRRGREVFSGHEQDVAKIGIRLAVAAAVSGCGDGSPTRVPARPHSLSKVCSPPEDVRLAAVPSTAKAVSR